MTDTNTTSSDALTHVSLDTLFESYQFGKVTLKNRIAMAPMTRNQCPGKIPGENIAQYYRRRTEGGVGLIITEGANPGHPSAAGMPQIPDIAGEKALAGWKRVVEEVHDAGGAIIPQLWHCGSIRKKGIEPDPSVPGFAPSAIMHPSFDGKGEVPHEMTQQDIDDIVEAFAQAAKDSEELGFDGVEIHGAHSYLIDLFFWDATNKRSDKYGGATLVERSRFAIEIIEAIRANVSPDFPVVFRFSQWKQGDYRHKMFTTPTEMEKFLLPLSEAGVDYFHASTRRFNDPEFEESDLNLAGWSKKITGKPSITVGSVGLDSDFLRSYAGTASNKAGLDDLMRRLENDEFDLVAVGRALLSDAQWCNKIREGREGEIITFTPEHMQKFE